MTFWALAFRVRQYLKGSLWVVPFLGALLGPVVAQGVRRLDDVWTVPESLQYSASTASGVLTAITAAMIGLLGFVVTVVVLVVQLATGTLSPRFMRLWYRDRLQKLVLASFVTTFTYSFALLSMVEENSVPDIGVLTAGFLASASLVLLLLFLDRFTHNLRPVAVAASVSSAGRRVIRTAVREAASEPAGSDASARLALVVRTRRCGVVQAVDRRGLAAVARRHGCLLVLRYGVGDFVPQDAPLIEVYGTGRVPGPRRLRGCVALGQERTIDQDPAFAMRILVDIAIRALSPAVNDPTTAIQLIDYVEDLIRAIAGADSGGPIIGAPVRAAVVVSSHRWDDYIALAVTEIREYGAGSIQVCRRLRAMLEGLRDDVTPEQRVAVDAQLGLLDLAVSQAWRDPAAREYARLPDRQGIGGPPVEPHVGFVPRSSSSTDRRRAGPSA
jgi:uncharacterized membrane protein